MSLPTVNCASAIMSQFSDQGLLDAAENGEFDNVRDILSHPDYGHTICETYYNERNNNPLVLAAKSGNLKLVKFLIEKLNFDKESVGTVLFSQEEDHISEAPVLWTAATAGHLHMVKYLTSIGCDVNKPTVRAALLSEVLVMTVIIVRLAYCMAVIWV